MELIVNKGSNAMVPLNNKVLLEAFSIYGYNGSIRSFDGCPLLMLALLGNHIDIAKLLIISNVDVNARSSNGRTPISWARENSKENIIAFLTKNGAEG